MPAKPSKMPMTEVNLVIQMHDAKSDLTTMIAHYTDHRGQKQVIEDFSMPGLLLSGLVGPISPADQIGDTFQCQVPTMMLMNDEELRAWVDRED